MAHSPSLESVPPSTSYNPGGTIVHGDLPKDLALQIATLGVQIKGVKLWYTCNSCKRTIRFEEIEEHNETFHNQVKCEQCAELVDQFHFRNHKRESCLARITFCRYCSYETTFRDLASHEENCYQAKLVKNREIQPISCPSFIPDVFPEIKGLVQLGQEFSLAHADRNFQRPSKLAKKYQNEYGNSIFPVKMSESADSLTSVHDQEENCKKLVEFCNSRTVTKPEELLRKKFLDLKLKEDAEKVIDDLLKNPVHPVNKNKNERRKAPSGYATVQQMMIDHAKQGSYLRNIHKLNSQISRQEARKYAELKKRSDILLDFESHKRQLQELKTGLEKKLMIDQAMQLIENQEKEELIPNDEWKNFIQDVKSTRKIWKNSGGGHVYAGK